MDCTDVSSGNSRARSSARASRLRQITGEGQRERRGIVHLAAPAERERLGGALPGGGRIPVKRFPHRSARFEQAGPFAPDPPAARSRRRPRTSVSRPAAGRSEPAPAPPDARCVSSVAGLFLATAAGRREFVVGTLQEGDEIGDQEQRQRIPASAPPRDGRSAAHRRGDSGGADCMPCWHMPVHGRDPARWPCRFRRSPTRVWPVLVRARPASNP